MPPVVTRIRFLCGAIFPCPPLFFSAVSILVSACSCIRSAYCVTLCHSCGQTGGAPYCHVFPVPPSTHTLSLLDYCFLRTCNNIFCSRRTTAKHRFHKFANAHLCGCSPPLCPELTVIITMHRHYNRRTALFSTYLSS